MAAVRHLGVDVRVFGPLTFVVFTVVLYRFESMQ